MTLWPSTSRTSNAAKAMGLPGRLRASKTAWMPSLPSPATASPSRTADATGQRISRSQASPGSADQLAAGAAEGVDGAMVADVELGALAVELGLGAVARVREPARVLQAGGEHRGDEGHGGSSIVATAPSLALPVSDRAHLPRPRAARR